MCISNSTGGYPLGADEDPRAPWHEKEPEKIKLKVCVSVTYSKSVEVIVPKYYEREDLIEAVEDLGILPNAILKEHQEELIASKEDNTWLTNGLDFGTLQDDIKRHEPWHEDELEVIEDKFISHSV